MAFRSPRKTGLPCAAVLSLATFPDTRTLSMPMRAPRPGRHHWPRLREKQPGASPHKRRMTVSSLPSPPATALRPQPSGRPAGKSGRDSAESGELSAGCLGSGVAATGRLV
jgi:hypothetical protein